MEDAVAAGNFKMAYRAIIRSSPAFNIAEDQTNRICFASGVHQARRIRLQCFFAISMFPGEHGKTFADGLFILGMNVVHIADIIDDRHADFRAVGGGKGLLSFPDFRQFIGIKPVIVGGELNKVEFEAGVFKSLFPTIEKRLHSGLQWHSASVRQIR